MCTQHLQYIQSLLWICCIPLESVYCVFSCTLMCTKSLQYMLVYLIFILNVLHPTGVSLMSLYTHWHTHRAHTICHIFNLYFKCTVSHWSPSMDSSDFVTCPPSQTHPSYSEAKNIQNPSPSKTWLCWPHTHTANWQGNIPYMW
jgi:hypothetical protein